MIWFDVRDVPGYVDFVKIEPIFKGLSSDKKYYIETTDGQRLLLRVNDIAKHDRKKAGCERMQRMDAADVPVPRLMDVGACNNGNNYYLLTTWFHGENMKKALPLLSETEQYVTGLKVGAVSVIDWQICDFEGYGDPWDDFRSNQCEASPHFATGCINGYFDNEIPAEFWKLNAFYMAVGSITSIPCAYYRYPSELEPLIEHNLNVLRWFDNMINPVPTWYLKDFYIQWTDGKPYKLKSPVDFSFLSKYGKVFKVFDNQGSGNICFGVADSENKYFVKFAGAPTGNYSGAPQDAIERLKCAVPAYWDLAHPNLIRLISDEEINNGYAVVFEWVDAIHVWTPDGGQEFKRLPQETHFKIFDEILDFHAHMAAKGYTALDFYEDHIMWDVVNERTVICDIDFYSKGWYEGMSGIWNTDCEWYSPEQFIDGAAIDEVSCVYAMGATAFALFGDGRDRCIEKWKLSKGLFDVAKRAASDDRNQRQQSVRQLIDEWEAAKQ